MTIIVPFAAGGGTDQSARLAAQLLTKSLHQTFVVENKAGAGGMIGLGQLARAKPDGYTLGWAGNSPLTIAPYLQKNPPYDPATAFTAVSLAGLSSSVLLARPGLDVHTLQALVAKAKAQPGSISFGTSGIGTSTHLLGELLKSETQTDLLHVPYKSDAECISALLGGQVDIAWVSSQIAIPQVSGGKLIGLVVSGDGREPAMSGVPTVKEAGVPNMQVPIFFGLVGPARLPHDIVDKLAAAMANVARDEEYRRALSATGLHAASSSPAQFSALLESHRTRWSTLIRQLNISGQ
ncbi:Bug family tripartite tricarboxylate transporter substrate binding protein [Bordetella ansorpii]|uniref:Bug family tripartite tricarboxylate transporter substrate binding protein n=1 Tax=Bordetella ansorpii TaxID=288768 RepID=UPI0018D3B79E|nr:tripartite tricarboxylate transporter substrate binding protein [Bordetella ansorpii]